MFGCAFLLLLFLIFKYLLFKNCFYLFLCLCIYVEVKGQLSGVGFSSFSHVGPGDCHQALVIHKWEHQVILIKLETIPGFRRPSGPRV